MRALLSLSLPICLFPAANRSETRDSLPAFENRLEAEQRKQAADHAAKLPLFTASAAAARAAAWSVWEGLPRRFPDKDLLEKEKRRVSVVTLHGELFYPRAAAVPGEQVAQFSELLATPETYAVYEGVKFCGGFHADYAIEWQANNHAYRALVCFGCHELRLVSDDIQLLCDLPQASVDRLATLLKPYRKERPVPATRPAATTTPKDSR